MSRSIFFIQEQDTVLEAITLMAEKRIGGILVLRSNTPVSIFTERDLIGKVLARRLNPETETVGKHASGPLKFADANVTEKELLTFMLKENVRRVPILEDGKVSGMVTCLDMLRALAKDETKGRG